MFSSSRLRHSQTIHCCGETGYNLKINNPGILPGLFFASKLRPLSCPRQGYRNFGGLDSVEFFLQ